MPDTPELLPDYRIRREQEPISVAIIGAGPSGLEAALYARRLGYKVLLFEREAEIGAGIRSWQHVSMFTHWDSNRTPLGELALREAAHDAKRKPALPRATLYPTGGEYLARYLEPLAELMGDSLHLETRVMAIGRSYMFPDEHSAKPEERQARRFRLLTRSPRDERIFTADFVFDCTGTAHAPHWMGAGGLPALGEMGGRGTIFHTIPDILGRDRIHFLGKRTLLVGNGTSAATCAVLLSELLDKEPPATLVWITRSRDELPVPIVPSDPLPRRDTTIKKANLLVINAHPRLEYLPVTQLEAVQHSLQTGRYQVTLQVNHVTRRLAFDSIIAAVGCRTDLPTFEHVLHPAEPGLYVLGAKASPADFYLTGLREPIRDAFRAIASDPDLDLYAQSYAALHAQARLSRDPQGI